MDAMAAARAAAEAAMYETATEEEMLSGQYHQQHFQQQQFDQHEQHMAAVLAEEQERGYLETLQQNSEQLGMPANLLHDFLGGGSSSGKDHSTNELLHLLASQQGQQSMQQSCEPEDSMNMRPEEHYMTIAQDGKCTLSYCV